MYILSKYCANKKKGITRKAQSRLSFFGLYRRDFKSVSAKKTWERCRAVIDNLCYGCLSLKGTGRKSVRIVVRKGLRDDHMV